MRSIQLALLLYLNLISGCAEKAALLTEPSLVDTTPYPALEAPNLAMPVMAPYYDNDESGVLASDLAFLVSSVESSQGFISGRCLCRYSESSLEIPCSNVSVELVDAVGRVLRRLRTSDGEFLFPARTGRRYSLRVASPQFAVIPEPEGPFGRGDDVVLHLVTR